MATASNHQRLSCKQQTQHAKQHYVSLRQLPQANQLRNSLDIRIRTT